MQWNNSQENLREVGVLEAKVEEAREALSALSICSFRHMQEGSSWGAMDTAEKQRNLSLKK
jgi:hypothetical protein